MRNKTVCTVPGLQETPGYKSAEETKPIWRRDGGQTSPCGRRGFERQVEVSWAEWLALAEEPIQRTVTCCWAEE